jgi:hypothetical protein
MTMPSVAALTARTFRRGDIDALVQAAVLFPGHLAQAERRIDHPAGQRRVEDEGGRRRGRRLFNHGLDDRRGLRRRFAGECAQSRGRVQGAHRGDHAHQGDEGDTGIGRPGGKGL